MKKYILIIVLMLSLNSYSGNPFGGGNGNDDEEEPGNSEFGHSHNPKAPISDYVPILFVIGLLLAYRQTKKLETKKQ